MKKIFLTITVLISTLALKATITVTNVNVTNIASISGTYALDLDNDAVADFSIEAYQVGVFNRIDIKMLSGSSEIVSLTAATQQVVQAMSFGATFGSAWQSTTTHVYHHVEFINLSGLSDQYIALRLLKGGNYYYGWVRLNVNFNGDDVTIVDYAFEDTPNTLITAGQTVSTTTGIASSKNEASFSVYPNPVKNTLTIKSVNKGNQPRVNIYNVNGVLVQNTKQQGLKLDVSNLASGVYFVELITDNNKTIKKVIKTE